MDGTIINTEDLYTEATTKLLAKYGKGPLDWRVKLKLQGRPGPESVRILLDEYDIDITPEEWQRQAFEVQENIFSKADFTSGALELLQKLSEKNIPIALGTSSNIISFHRKTAHLQHGFKYFNNHIVTGDDPRIPTGRGKPHPDIWYACLNSINEQLKAAGSCEIQPHECLIFEDGIPGVESGINANAHVIWIPHPEALPVLNGEEHVIIGNHGEIITDLKDFDLSKYGL
jgi:pseudouridine-5'-monophosphatase